MFSRDKCFETRRSPARTRTTQITVVSSATSAAPPERLQGPPHRNLRRGPPAPGDPRRDNAGAGVGRGHDRACARGAAGQGPTAGRPLGGRRLRRCRPAGRGQEPSTGSSWSARSVRTRAGRPRPARATTSRHFRSTGRPGPSLARRGTRAWTGWPVTTLGHRHRARGLCRSDLPRLPHRTLCTREGRLGVSRLPP